MPGVSQAQAEDSVRPDPSEPIVVTGRGLQDPPAQEVYDSQTIARERLLATPSGRIEDSLSSIAGFQQFRRSDSRSANPSAQGATLRALGGNATSRALVLLDGVPMADPFFGAIPFTAMPPDGIESVRIVRGGGSGPFGTGALAGTIELASAMPPPGEAFAGSALVNDRGESEASAILAAPLGAGRAVVSGRWDRGAGFYTTPADQRVPATARAAFEARSVQMRGVAPIAPDTELQARVLLFDDHRTLRFAGADSAIEGQDASLRVVRRGDWQVDALAYVQARNFSNIVVSATRFVPVLDQRSTPATGVGGKIELRPPVGPDRLVRIGADYRRSSGQLHETALSASTGAVTERRRAGGANSDIGMFVEGEQALGAITLTSGLRLDRYAITGGFYRADNAAGAPVVMQDFADRGGWSLSARGGVIYHLGGRLSARAAAYTGLRLPTLNELYRPFVVFPITTLANAALRNERLRGFEGGLQLGDDGDAVRLSLTLFDNRVRDAIANVTLDPVTRQRQNIDEIRARGIEAQAGLAFGRMAFDGSLALVDAAAHQPGAAFDGLRPAQTPRLSASASLSYRPAEGWLSALSLRHVGRQFEDDLQSDALPAATTLDAFVRVPLRGRLALVLRAENLTGTEVVTRNQAGSVDLGAPRTVWGGLRLGL